MLAVAYFSIQYIAWHYSSGFKEVAGIAENLVVFTYRFFSISALSNNLFSPWRAMHDEPPHSGFHPSAIASSFLVNILMRIIGFIMRIIVLHIGVLALILSFLIGVLGTLSWAIMPLLIATSFFVGISLFLHSIPL